MKFATAACLLLLLSSLCGCSSLPSSARWAQAAKRAALAPQTWAPLAGAALFKATDWDRRTSDWAVDHTPLFGSTGRAETGSDLLVLTEVGVYGASALVVDRRPASATGQSSLRQQLTGDGAAVLSAAGVTEGLKTLSHRRRPDGSDHQSFPSQHATTAAALATRTSRNLEALDLSPAVCEAADGGLLALTAATGWARIEAGKHYPSDVLAGAAIGYFFSAWVGDAVGQGSSLAASLELSRHGALLAWQGRF